MIKSLKKGLITDFTIATTLKGFADNSVILVTPAGIITGKPCIEPNAPESDAGLSLIAQIADGSVNEKEPTSPNDGFVLLQDVELQSNGQKYNFVALAVFYDQIIGVSLGKLNG